MSTSTFFVALVLPCIVLMNIFTETVAAPTAAVNMQSAIRTDPSPVPILKCPDVCKDEPWAQKECMMALVPCELVPCPLTVAGLKPRAKCAPIPSPSPIPTPAGQLSECTNVCKDAPWAMKDCMNTTADCELVSCPSIPGGLKERARCSPKKPTPTPYYR